MAEVTLDRVSKQYGTTTALSEINLSIQDGELLTLLGPSGCGKTTTLRLIAGFLEPSTGSIHIGGKDVTRDPPHRRALGMVFQSYALFPHLSIGDNIGFGLRERHVPRPLIRKRVRELLELIQLPGVESRYPAQLSGGQQQRVALARAIACEPRVLLMDEPLAALDLKLREAMQTEIRRIQRELRITTIYVTHDQTEAMRISDHVAVMNLGKVAQFGTPREIYERPHDRFVASFIGKINLIPAEVVDCRSDVVVVKIGAHPVEVHDGATNALPASVVVGIRPEDIQLTSTSHNINGKNWLRGQVESTTFIGSTCEVRVRVNSNTVLLVEAHPESISDPSLAEVIVSWSPTKGRILSS
jgi:spermidine/putrescine ABC transporter ATP-binding subunit